MGGSTSRLILVLQMHVTLEWLLGHSNGYLKREEITKSYNLLCHLHNRVLYVISLLHASSNPVEAAILKNGGRSKFFCKSLA